MAKIYISYSNQDRDVALALSERLKSAGHSIIIDTDSLVPGQDWQRVLMDGLKSADVFVSILSPNALRSNYVVSELGAARAFADKDQRMLVIPVIIAEMDIPPTIRDILAIVSPDRNIDEIFKRIERAITAFAGRLAAFQKSEQVVRDAIEDNKHGFIAKQLSTLTSLEKRYRIIGIVWYSLGFIVLSAGLGFIYYGLAHSTAPTADSWITFAYVALRSVLVLAVLAAATKYGFGLGRAFTTESLKAADRLHAIGFGQFYLQVFGAKATWPEVKEAFQNWNIDRRNAFADTDVSEVDPKVMEQLAKLLAAAMKDKPEPKIKDA